MKTDTASIQAHYRVDSLFVKILSQLKANGEDLSQITRKHIAGVDEFHVRGAAVSKELASSIDFFVKNVLDIGCGLGGACRMLAEEYNCQTTGIDLSPEYINTAKELSRLVKLEHQTEFIQADATNLPFENEQYDIIWTQHVQMNISDKEAFYSEIHRVLKPRGYFLYYDIFRNNDNEVNYPMPWASRQEQSFLFTPKQMENILASLGFKKVTVTNQTQAGIAFFDKVFDPNTPKNNVGLNLLMGNSTIPKLKNLHEHLKQGILQLESGIYCKG